MIPNHRHPNPAGTIEDVAARQSRHSASDKAARPPLSGKRLQVVAITLAVSAFGSASARAQSAYFAANGQSSIVPWSNGFFGFDFTEAKMAVNFVEPVFLPCAEDGCTPDRLNFTFHMSGAARKGQRDLIGKLDFVPGFDLGGGIAFVARGAGSGYDIVFVRATYSTQQRDIILADIQTGTATIDDEAQRSFVATLGFNHGFSATTTIGLALEGRRELATPGAQLAREFCTPGTAASGFRVVVCSDRFVGPLANLWTGQARADLDIALTRPAKATSARVSLIAAGALDFIEAANTEASFALGPAISLPTHPGQPVAVFLVGIRDAFQSNTSPNADAGSYFGDHVLFRLAVSIPFRTLVGTHQ